MAFKSSVIGTYTLDGTLVDEASTRDFEADVAGNVVFQRFNEFELFQNKSVSRQALLFEAGQSYSANGGYSFTDMAVAFWWNSPGAVGYTRHAVTRDLQTKFAPIVCKADKVSSPTDFTGATFFISEVAASKTTNAIRVHLCSDTSGGTSVTHIYTSAAYNPGLRHVMISFLKADKLFRIDIDGKPGTFFSAPSGVFNGGGKLRLNNFVPEIAAHQTVQTGYIYDLVISALVSSDNESLRMMRYGYEYITNVVLSTHNFVEFGIETSQVSTVTTSQIIAEGGNILVSRSNGKILQGKSPIWDREFDYLTPRSVARLNTSTTDPIDMEEPEDGSKRISEWTTSGLRVKGVTVRV